MAKAQRHKKVFLSIVIPSYNEERRISSTLDEFIRYLSKQNYTYKIIIVDDGSTDSTGNLLADYSTRYNFIKIISNLENMGKGYSVKRGIEEADGEYILFSDADLSVKPEYITTMIDEMKSGTDITMGSRAVQGAKTEISQPWLRGKLGVLFNAAVREFITSDFLDTQCGFKCFKSEIAKRICREQTLYGYCFDIELLLLAQKNGYNIKEVPVVWSDKKGSKLSIFDAPIILVELLKLTINKIKGRYNKNNAK